MIYILYLKTSYKSLKKFNILVLDQSVTANYVAYDPTDLPLSTAASFVTFLKMPLKIIVCTVHR